VKSPAQVARPTVAAVDPARHGPAPLARAFGGTRLAVTKQQPGSACPTGVVREPRAHLLASPRRPARSTRFVGGRTFVRAEGVAGPGRRNLIIATYLAAKLGRDPSARPLRLSCSRFQGNLAMLMINGWPRHPADRNSFPCRPCAEQPGPRTRVVLAESQARSILRIRRPRCARATTDVRPRSSDGGTHRTSLDSLLGPRRCPGRTGVRRGGRAGTGCR
jgi:hypothetical protein